MIVPSKKFLSTVFVLFMSLVCAAYQNPRPPVPNEPNAPGPPGFPIDNGLVVFFIIALIYGIYKSIKLVKSN